VRSQQALPSPTTGFQSAQEFDLFCARGPAGLPGRRRKVPLRLESQSTDLYQKALQRLPEKREKLFIQ
jgi:hypothetical protein